MYPPRAAGRLILLLGAELASLAGLLRLGSSPWLRVPRHDVLGWLAAAPVEDAAAACIRLAAIATLAWLLGGTVLYTAVRVARVGLAVRVLRWLTVPAVRRLVDRAVAVTVVTSCVAGAGSPALADPVAPPPPGVVAPSWFADRPPPGLATPPRAAPARSPPAMRPRARPSDAAARPRRPSTPRTTAPSRPPGPVVHEVVAGDSLWGVAARRVGSRDAEVVGAYWVRVVAVNRDRIRSGDPDLIYPGERIVLPEPPG